MQTIPNPLYWQVVASLDWSWQKICESWGWMSPLSSVQKQLMNPFDADIASFIHNEMRKHGVKLALGHTVEGFEERDGGVDVLLKDEQPLHADMVILAIGVSPETTHLAKDAGLELGIKGSIVVNDRMETSISDIYAVGDAVQVKHFVTGQDTLLSLAGPANKQGRIAADNICGGDSHYTGSQGSSVIKIFGMTCRYYRRQMRPTPKNRAGC